MRWNVMDFKIHENHRKIVTNSDLFDIKKYSLAIVLMHEEKCIYWWHISILYNSAVSILLWTIRGFLWKGAFAYFTFIHHIQAYRTWKKLKGIFDMYTIKKEEKNCNTCDQKVSLHFSQSFKFFLLLLLPLNFFS